MTDTIIKDTIIFGVERGWQASRLLSLKAANQGLRADMLIKGRVEGQILQVITKYENIAIASCARPMYRFLFLCRILKSGISGRLRNIVIEGKKVEQWIGALGAVLRAPVYLLDERGIRQRYGL